MKPEPPRLSLLTPIVEDAEAFRPLLGAACGAGQISAVLLRLAPADERTLVNRVKLLAATAHAQGAVLLLVEPEGGPVSVDALTVATRGGADGVHARSPGPLRDLRGRLGPERTLGAGGLRAKHDAMEAGESGADYVMFGEPRPDGSLAPLDLVAERAEWWAEIFQVPCIAFAPSLDDLAHLAATGAEFVALGDAVWTHPGGPAAAVRDALAVLARVPEAVA